MNYTLTDPIGVDIPIQKIQTFLHDQIGWTPIKVFGRIYKNRLDGRIVPQFYKGEGEYIKDVFTDDQKGNKANIFFIVDDSHSITGDSDFRVKIKVVVMADLGRIYGNSAHRRDSKCQSDIFALLKRKQSLKINSMETGIESVLKGLSFEGVKNSDIEPFHTFSFNGTVTYKFNC